LRKNGTVEAWGDPYSGVTNVPIGLSNVVAVATGGEAALALQATGTVVAWGDPESSSTTNVPAGTLGVKAISTGFDHNLVIESGVVTPDIFTQPTNQYAPAGGTVTFSVAGGVAGLQYQWQSNGVNIIGATNATLTLANVGATNQASYQAIIITDAGSITSSAATFTLVVAPQIASVTPPNAATTWMNYSPTLGVGLSSTYPGYPYSYKWQLNSTNITGASSANYAIPSLTPGNEGNYTVTITNIAGSTNATWDMRLALSGMAEAWGDDDNGECDRPAALTNIAGIAAGEYQSVAVTDSGTIAQWGQYTDDSGYYSVTNFSHCSAPPTSGVVSVAAGLGQALALLTNGTVVAWGLTNDEDGLAAYGTQVPTNLNLTNVIAVACGWEFNVALLSNGTVKSWGLASFDGYTLTNVPSGLSNVVAVAAGPLHTLALRSDGTVAAWGYNGSGETNVPTGLTNVVAIAAGLEHSLALSNNGTVIAWGGNDYGQCNVPAGLSNVMAIAAGDYHSAALLNNGTIMEWGDNSSGQTNVPTALPTVVLVSSPPSFYYVTNPPVVVKSIAAGGDHTIAAIFSPTVQYPINISKDLLLIYNTNSTDSSNVCQYYLAHRPMVVNANVLGIGCTTNEIVEPTDFTNTIVVPLQNWLAQNPTKRPQYLILFEDIPSRVDLSGYGGSTPSVQYVLNLYSPSYQPFITAMNMNGVGGTNDCIAYINKLVSFGSNYSPGQLVISASAGSYSNSIWYFDEQAYSYYGANAAEGVTNAKPTATIVAPTATYTSQATNVAGYFTAGWDGGLGTGPGRTNSFATNGQVLFFGNSSWYIMTTIDSFDGQRSTFQASFLTWFASNAFGGTNYSNTPVGAVSTVDEPGVTGKPSPYYYYGSWASGKPFGISAWWGQSVGFGTPGIRFQATGDPFVRQ
jgi:alpha-tubulin suppressor-like RCC1 family protein